MGACGGTISIDFYSSVSFEVSWETLKCTKKAVSIFTQSGTAGEKYVPRQYNFFILPKSLLAFLKSWEITVSQT